MMPMSNIPPRDKEGLRKWRAQRYEEQKREEYERMIDEIVTRPPMPKKRVAPTLKKEPAEPGRYPMLGQRAKKRREIAQEGEKGYVE